MFTSAVNLMWEDGSLLTLHGPGWVRAPFAAVCDRMPDDVPVGSLVARFPGGVAFANVEVRWDRPALWDPGPPPLAPLVLLDLSHWLRGSSLVWEQGLDDLAEGIRSRNLERFLSSAMALVGRGEGLTPAGDDVLVGALAALWRFDPFWRGRMGEIRHTLVPYAREATTRVGAAFLTHALRGAFAEPLLKLATASEPASVHAAAEALIGFGATSGRHTLAGFLACHRALGR